MDSYTFSDALDLFYKINSYHNQSWMFYALIALGILGFSFGETYSKMSDIRSCIIISIGFIAFSLSNIFSMYDNLELYNTLLQQIKKEARETNFKQFNIKPIMPKFEEKRLFIIITYHLILDGCVLLSIWRKYLKREEKRVQ